MDVELLHGPCRHRHQFIWFEKFCANCEIPV